MIKKAHAADFDYVMGKVVKVLPHATFRVAVEDREVFAYISGKMHRFRILYGDNVMLELSKYDKDRGRIVRRCE